MARSIPLLLAVAVLSAGPARPAPLAEPAPVGVRVRDSAGRPVSGAIAAVPAGTASAVAADADGRLAVPVGTLLKIEAPGFLPAEGPVGAVVTLLRPSSVTVRVLDDRTGRAIPEARVDLFALPSDGASGAQEDDLGPLAEDGAVDRLATATADAAGRVRLGGLASGTYRVRVSATGRVPAARRVAPEPEGEAAVTVRLRRASVIEGLVHASGKPVAGARLRLVPAVPRAFGPLLGRAGGRRFRALTQRELRADGSGRFRIDGLPERRPVPYVVVALGSDGGWGVGLVPASGLRLGAEVAEEERHVVVDVDVGSAVPVSGRVLGADGEPLPGVPVVAELVREDDWQPLPPGRRRRGRSPWGGGRPGPAAEPGVDLLPAFEEWGGGPESVSGAEGRFRLSGLPPGRWRLAARPADHAGSEPVVVEVGGEPVRSVELLLGEGRRVTGVVVDSGGDPVAEAEVTVEVVQPPRRWALQRVTTTTGADGRFEAHGLREEGELRARADGPGLAPETVEVPGTGEVRLVLQRTAQLEGTVVSALTGEPLRQFTVSPTRVTEVPGGGRGRWRGRAQGDQVYSEDGSFAIDELEAGRWAVLVRAPGHLARASAEVEVGEGESAHVGVVSLVPGATVDGVVLDADTQEPVVGATVVLEGSASGGRWMRRRRFSGDDAPVDTTDGSGRFRLESVPPGEFTLRSSHHEYPERADHSVRISVGEAAEGEPVPATIEMERGGAVHGVVLDAAGDPVAGVLVVASDPAASGRPGVLGLPVESGEDGTFALSPLPEGRVEVRRVDRLESAVPAVVRKGEVTDVTLQDGGARLYGRVTVGGAPAPAQVRLRGTRWSDPGEPAAEYEIAGVPPGTWTLDVTILPVPDAPADAQPRRERVTVSVPPDVRELREDLEFEEEDPRDDALVQGRIVDGETGEGFTGWLVQARSGGEAPVTTVAKDGDFALIIPRDGTWRISVIPTGSTGRTYDAPEPVELEVVDGAATSELPLLEAWRRPELDVRVLDLSGAPVSGVRCAALSMEAHLGEAGLRLRGPRWTVTDALGRARLTADEPGLHDVILVVPSRALVIRTAVDVGSGEELALSLPHVGSVEVRGAREVDLLDLPGGWWLRLSPATLGLDVVEPLADGLVIRGLPPGTYRIRADTRIEDVEVVAGAGSSIVDFDR